MSSSTSSPPVEPGLMTREAGLSLIEVTASLLVLTVGVFALGAVLLTTNQLREDTALRADALVRLRAMMERIKDSAPDTLAANYSDAQFTMGGLEATRTDVAPVTVTVDATDPVLIEVSASTSWGSGNNQESLIIRTSIYNDKGI